MLTCRSHTVIDSAEAEAPIGVLSNLDLLPPERKIGKLFQPFEARASPPSPGALSGEPFPVHVLPMSNSLAPWCLLSNIPLHYTV